MEGDRVPCTGIGPGDSQDPARLTRFASRSIRLHARKMSEEEEERTDTAPPPREEADHGEEPSRKQSDQLPEERPASEREDSDDEADAPSS